MCARILKWSRTVNLIMIFFKKYLTLCKCSSASFYLDKQKHKMTLWIFKGVDRGLYIILSRFATVKLIDILNRLLSSSQARCAPLDTFTVL